MQKGEGLILLPTLLSYGIITFCYRIFLLLSFALPLIIKGSNSGCLIPDLYLSSHSGSRYVVSPVLLSCVRPLRGCLIPSIASCALVLPPLSLSPLRTTGPPPPAQPPALVVEDRPGVSVLSSPLSPRPFLTPWSVVSVILTSSPLIVVRDQVSPKPALTFSPFFLNPLYK